MANMKVTDLGSLSAPADNDLFHIIDVSDSSYDAAGTDKRIAMSDLRANVLSAPDDLTLLSNSDGSGGGDLYLKTSPTQSGMKLVGGTTASRLLLNSASALGSSDEYAEFHTLNSALGGGLLLAGWGTSGGSVPLNLSRSVGGAIGTHGLVPDLGNVGVIRFRASDGVKFVNVAAITVTMDGATGVDDMPGKMIFQTTPDGSAAASERMRIDNQGRVLVNQTASFGRYAQRFEVGGVGNNTGVALQAWSNSAACPMIDFNKSRSPSQGGFTIVQLDDFIGQLAFNGADGAVFASAAIIKCQSDGTPGAGDMPGRLVFMTTPDGTVTPLERFRIDNKGNVIASLAALVVGATDGFLYLPSAPGVPTGTPTAYTGRIPIVVDTTNNKLMYYNAGWRDVGFSLTETNYTSNYTLLAADRGKRLVATTAAIVFTIPAIGVLGNGFRCEIVNDSGGTVTINGPGATDVTMANGDICTIREANGKQRVITDTSTVIS